MNIFKRYQKFYRANGLKESLLKILTTPLRFINKINYSQKKKNIFSNKSYKKKFELIYKNNFWSSSESVSGLGSELKNTINLRNKLVKLIQNYNIKSILDVPCGDFNWIKHILNKDLTYIGGDIVSTLIDNNNKFYKNDRINFIQIDITEDTLPNSDLMICRDCLIHLSFNNIKLFFNNFIRSNIEYILLTSYKLKNTNYKIKNEDILDGDFREIDLSNQPFNLPKPLFEILDKDEQTKKSGYLCYLNLYSRKQLQKILN